MPSKRNDNETTPARGRGFTKYRIQPPKAVTPEWFREQASHPLAEQLKEIARQAAAQLRRAGLPGSYLVLWEPDNPRSFREQETGGALTGARAEAAIDQYVIKARNFDKDSNEGILARVLAHATRAGQQDSNPEQRIQEAYLLGVAVTEQRAYKYQQVKGGTVKARKNRGTAWAAAFRKHAAPFLQGHDSSTSAEAWKAIPTERQADDEGYAIYRRGDQICIESPTYKGDRSKARFEKSWRTWLDK